MLWAFTVLLAPTCILSEAYEEALEGANHTLRIPHALGYWPHAVRASALLDLGRIDGAKKALDLALRARTDLSIGFL